MLPFENCSHWEKCSLTTIKSIKSAVCAGENRKLGSERGKVDPQAETTVHPHGAGTELHRGGVQIRGT